MGASKKFTINLESLLDLSAKLNDTYDEAFILNSAALSLMGKLRVLRAAVFTREESEGAGGFELKICKGKCSAQTLPLLDIQTIRGLNPDSPEEQKLIDAGYAYCSPVIFQKRHLALICLSKKFNSAGLSTNELQYAYLVSAITANAMNSAKAFKILESEKKNAELRNQLLAALFEVGKDFSALLSKNQILKMLSYRLMGQLMVSKFAVYLFDSSGRIVNIINRFSSVLSTETLLEISTAESTGLLDNFELSEKAAAELKEAKARVISPMIAQGAVKGLLLVGSKMNGREFTKNGLLFLEAVGNTAISALENERLFQEEIEKKKLEKELDLALSIQKNLLPKGPPEPDGYEIYGFSKPSSQVGGDYYDFIELPGGDILIAIADVSGKGAPASLLMANVQAALRALAPLSLPLAELAERINAIVFNNTSSEKFITLFMGAIEKKNCRFRYLNAGHNPPYYIDSDKVTTLTEGGIILGIMEETAGYKEGVIDLPPGSIVAMYTDGVTEAVDKSGDEFGEARLERILKENKSLSPKELTGKIISEIEEFSSGARQFDDITLALIKATHK